MYEQYRLIDLFTIISFFSFKLTVVYFPRRNGHYGLLKRIEFYDLPTFQLNTTANIEIFDLYLV
jgi:hypothetical protein